MKSESWDTRYLTYHVQIINVHIGHRKTSLWSSTFAHPWPLLWNFALSTICINTIMFTWKCVSRSTQLINWLEVIIGSETVTFYSSNMAVKYWLNVFSWIMTDTHQIVGNTVITVRCVVVRVRCRVLAIRHNPVVAECVQVFQRSSFIPKSTAIWWKNTFLW